MTRKRNYDEHTLNLNTTPIAMPEPGFLTADKTGTFLIYINPEARAETVLLGDQLNAAEDGLEDAMQVAPGSDAFIAGSPETFATMPKFIAATGAQTITITYKRIP